MGITEEADMCEWVLCRITEHSGTPERFIRKYRFFPEWLANMRRGKMCTMRTFFRLLSCIGYRLELDGQEAYTNAAMAFVIRHIQVGKGVPGRVFKARYKALSGDRKFWNPERDCRTLKFVYFIAIARVVGFNYEIVKA